MKRFILPLIVLGLCVESCNNSRKTSSTEAQAEPVAVNTVEGDWRVENVVVNDTVFAVPAEETPESMTFLTFDNGHYFIQTNCNSIQGEYTVSGDSITLQPGLRTEMACDNMRVEDLLVEVLPAIAKIDFQNDSVARLGAQEGPACIMLVRSNKEAAK